MSNPNPNPNMPNPNIPNLTCLTLTSQRVRNVFRFGFGAGPGGTKYPETAQPEGGGEDGYWWTTTPYLNGEFYWFAHFSSESDALISNYAAERAGLSVRCIKEAEW